jgi:hypothetical protein
MTRSGTLRLRLRRKLIAAFAAMVLALIGLGATAPGASAGTTYGLGACAWMNYKVKYGSTGDCVEAVQSFLRYAVNYRGFGPICPNTGLPGGVIAIDGRAGIRRLPMSAAIKSGRTPPTRWAGLVTPNPLASTAGLVAKPISPCCGRARTTRAISLET